MADGDDASAEIRATLIRLFEQDDWLLTGRAEADGKAILRQRCYKPATQCGICEYILESLHAGTRLTETGMGEPKYSHGVAWEMRNVDGKGLYIKLKIEDDEVRVLSFHY